MNLCRSRSAVGSAIALASILAAAEDQGTPFVISSAELETPIDRRAAVQDVRGYAGGVIVSDRPDSETKRLSLFAVTEDNRLQARPVLQANLSERALFFDWQSHSEGGRLYVLAPEGLVEVKAGDSELVIEQSTLYRGASAGSLTRMNMFEDLDGDGNEDAILPDFDGIYVYFADTDGFAAGQLLNLEQRMRAGFEGPRYDAPDLEIYDFNGDGAKDIGAFHGDRLLFFSRIRQEFSRDPTPIDLQIGLASERELQAMRESASDVDQSDLDIIQFERISDLNADDVPDIVTFKTESRGVFDKRTEYRIHFGSFSNGALTYSAEPEGTLPSAGFQIDLQELDVNGDAQRDLATTSLRLGLRKIVGALFSRSVGVDLELRTLAGTIYPAKPDYRSKIKVQFNLSTGFVSYPAVLFGDVNGDSLDDLLLQRNREQLRFRRAVSGGFSRDSLDIDVPLPGDGTLVEMVDVNGDGKQDVLIGYGLADGEDQANRVRLLVAR